MNIEELPIELQQILTPDDINFLNHLDLLLPLDLYEFEIWLTQKCNEPLIKSQKETQKKWATFKTIAEDLELTELSVRRAIDICFKTWNKKHLKNYSTQFMLQNMESNLKRFAEKNKPSIRAETAEKMKLFANKYFYSAADGKWYYRENQKD
jgi:hypothetical protein